MDDNAYYADSQSSEVGGGWEYSVSELIIGDGSQLTILHLVDIHRDRRAKRLEYLQSHH